MLSNQPEKNSPEHQKETTVEIETPEYKTPSSLIFSATQNAGAKTEELLLRFVVEAFEKKERGGQLPEKFSQFDAVTIENLSELPKYEDMLDFIARLKAREAVDESLIIEGVDYSELLRLH